jgi:hypothetical protein
MSRKLDTLAGRQSAQHAGFKAEIAAGEVVGVARSFQVRDKAGEQGGRLCLRERRVLETIKLPQPGRNRRQPTDASDLARRPRFVDMADVVGGNVHRRPDHDAPRVGRVRQHPICPPLSIRADLHPRHNTPAALKLPVHARVNLLGREQLQPQLAPRRREHPNKGLAGRHERANDAAEELAEIAALDVGLGPELIVPGGLQPPPDRLRGVPASDRGAVTHRVRHPILRNALAQRRVRRQPGGALSNDRPPGQGLARRGRHGRHSRPARPGPAGLIGPREQGARRVTKAGSQPHRSSPKPSVSDDFPSPSASALRASRISRSMASTSPCVRCGASCWTRDGTASNRARVADIT